MLFHRKNKLRNEYNTELIQELDSLKKNWLNQKSLLEKSLDPSEEAIITSKIAEVKYFYLFREAKRRKVRIKK